ncbi:hypothetical protein ACGYLM_18495 [Sulfitobacter sp. 1A10445]|uniref:hypothetical protein n=1 Tax=unclassified Sulfitobacter TaxID=196795 RepID=UPI003745252A
MPDDTGITPYSLVNGAALQLGRLMPRLYDNVYDLVTQKRHEEIICWKHAMPPLRLLKKKGAIPVVIVKHPSFWLRSFLSRPFHHYTASRSYLPRRIENLPRIETRVEDLILAKYEGYRTAVQRFGGIVVQYETLVTHFPAAQERLRAIFGHCRDLPNHEVRGFIRDSENSFAKKHENEVLRGLQYFDRAKLESHLGLLSFYGYSVDEWTATQPFSL